MCSEWIGYRDLSGVLTRSKAVEHARGCVATKIGLPDILVCRAIFDINQDNCDLQICLREKARKVIVNKLAVDQISGQLKQG
jgi:hypothetical protein